MGMGYSSGPMEPSTKGYGLKVKQPAKASSLTSMVILTKDSGSRIKRMGTGYTCMPNLGPGIRGIGKKICSMALGFKSTQMAIDTKVCSSKAKETGRALTIYRMELYTKANGSMVGSKAKEFVNGRMVNVMKVLG